MQNACKASQQLSEFTTFPLLPVELRSIIFKRAIISLVKQEHFTFTLINDILVTQLKYVNNRWLAYL
jgi:hypothetical protein